MPPSRTTPLSCLPIPAVTLEIRGQVDRLLIDRSITGPILESTGTGDPCSAREIVICDSIVQALDPATPAISSRIAQVELQRTTVFGDVVVNRLSASEALIQGLVRVTDNQTGCFRFSATDARPERRLPPQYESHLIAPAIANHVFTSRRLGDAAYAQLSPTAPLEILTGTARRSASSTGGSWPSAARTWQPRSRNTCPSASSPSSSRKPDSMRGQKP